MWRFQRLTRLVSHFPPLLCAQWKCFWRMVDNQWQSSWGKKGDFCTHGSFQCSDVIVVLVTGANVSGLWMPPGLQNQPLGRGRDKYSPEQLEPHGRFVSVWHQSGSSQGLCNKSLVRSGEYFVETWEITQFDTTLALSLPLPATTPFRRLVRFCLTRTSCPAQTHQKSFLSLSTPWALCFDTGVTQQR